MELSRLMKEKAYVEKIIGRFVENRYFNKYYCEFVSKKLFSIAKDLQNNPNKVPTIFVNPPIRRIRVICQK